MNVTNARFGSRTHRVVAVVDARRGVDDMATSRCLALAGELPAVLRTCTRPAWAGMIQPEQNPDAAPVHLRVDVAVEEAWYVGGQLLQLDYTVRGGSVRAEELAFDTGAFTNEFTIDRSDHLVAAPAQCHYCHDVTCSRCEDPVVPCAICGVGRCGRCGTTRLDLPLCTACSVARTITGARKLSKVGRHGVLLKGGDNVHFVEVALTPAKGTITVTWPSGEKRSWEPQGDQMEVVRRLVLGGPE